MNRMLRFSGRIKAVVAFVCCLAGGVWILMNLEGATGDDALWVGIGLYFIGKAFFVGPMLWLMTEQVARDHTRSNGPDS
jgi:hypothetical protein